MDAATTMGMPTPVVVRLSGVPLSTLDNWVRSGLVAPSLVGASGRRATRFWSLRDVVTVRVIKSLRDAGCPMQRLRKAVELLRSHTDLELASAVLFWDGRDVLAIDQAGAIFSLIASKGQTVFRETVVHVLTFPLGVWMNEAESVSEVVDVTTINDRRRMLTRGAQQTDLPAAAVS